MKFTIEIIQEIVKANYNLDCTVKPLAGEVDYNFLLNQHGSKFLLKICKPDVTQEEIDFQIELLSFLQRKNFEFELASVVPNIDNKYSFSYEMEEEIFSIRMHTWIEGRMLSDLNPRTSGLRFSWGEICGALSRELQDFDHPGAHRFDKWNPAESLFSSQYINYIQKAERIEIAEYFWSLFGEIAVPKLPHLRKSVNYSDAHEHNILFDDNRLEPKLTGVIDFGDAVYSQTICELAIACAYAGMFVADPIAAMSEVIKGYNSKFPILDEELVVLFPLICGRLMITVSSAAHNLYLEPENEYLQISVNPAWALLEKLRSVNPRFAHYHFRTSCGKNAHPNADLFQGWISKHEDSFIPPIDLEEKKVTSIDLGVGSLDLGNNANFETIPRFCKKVNEILEAKDAEIGIGGYGEIRPFYTTDAYQIEGNNGPQWRTMHLGTDYWTIKDTEVLSFWEGEVHAIKNNDNPCDYGPTVIIKHTIDSDFCFYSLYGHLSLKTLSHLRVGIKVEEGEVIGWVGDTDVNGGWPPHLHFQIILDLLGNEGDFPGVAFVSESKTWLSICPNLPFLAAENIDEPELDKIELLTKRNELLGKNLSISYQEPLHMVRGSGVYLYDTAGRRYLDTVNNVAHVGHEHPRVITAAQRQMELLNTNTRYLHENIVKYADALLSNCPKELEVVYLVNSGSEANELALRMVKTYTAQKDIIALEAGYHGNTGACIDISSYKFDGKGGSGAPEFTSICRIPDTYRGRYKNVSTAGKDYAQDVENAIQRIQEKGRNVAGFIAESILSCGGQIILPPDYLKSCYQMVRAQGGLCISDEVQVGFGRVGAHFWGFELQDVVPDIITCGKPIGNGHPLAAVITTRAVADAFTNGMEFFNTFGGNPVSCAIGNEVLSIIKDENLQQNAKQIGTYLIEGLNKLQKKYSIIGDVRGVGLFLGFELVKDRNTLEPAPDQAAYLANRIRDFGILMSTDGPLQNVIKIKPPMCINEVQAREILMRLDVVLAEDFMRI